MKCQIKFLDSQEIVILISRGKKTYNLKYNERKTDNGIKKLIMTSQYLNDYIYILLLRQ